MASDDVKVTVRGISVYGSDGVVVEGVASGLTIGISLPVEMTPTHEYLARVVRDALLIMTAESDPLEE